MCGLLPCCVVQTEAEAVAAQHDLDKQEWQAEMGRQQAAHDKAMGEVRAGPSADGGLNCRAAELAPRQLFQSSILPTACSETTTNANQCLSPPLILVHLHPAPSPVLPAYPSPSLPQLRAELATTQEELRQAQLAIQERDYAIATQQRCEAALAGHAGVWVAQRWVGMSMPMLGSLVRVEAPPAAKLGPFFCSKCGLHKGAV